MNQKNQSNQKSKQQEKNAHLKQLRNLILKKSLQVCQALITKTTDLSFSAFKKIVTNPNVEKQIDKQYNKFYFKLLKENYNIELGSMLVCNKNIVFLADENRNVILKEGDMFFLNRAFIKTPYKLKIEEIEDFIDNGQIFEGWIAIIYKDIKFNTNARSLYDKIKECDVKKLI